MHSLIQSITVARFILHHLPPGATPSRLQMPPRNRLSTAGALQQLPPPALLRSAMKVFKTFLRILQLPFMKDHAMFAGMETKPIPFGIRSLSPTTRMQSYPIQPTQLVQPIFIWRTIPVFILITITLSPLPTIQWQSLRVPSNTTISCRATPSIISISPPSLPLI